MSRLRRCLPGLALVVAVLATVALHGRQDKPPDKGKRTEEEDPDFKPTKPVLKIEESEFIDRASRRFPRPAADLKQAAREAKHPALRKLYDDLAVPHELLI